MTTLTVWILVMVQGTNMTYVSTYMQADKCYAAQASAPATVLAYCIEAKATPSANP